MLLALCVAGLSMVQPAVASGSPNSDCNAHGRLTQHYSVAQLRSALATMPADQQEYTNCYNVIQNQMLSELPGHHAVAKDPGSGGSSFISTPLLVVLIVLVLGGGALAGVAIQRRGGPPGEG